MVDKSAVEETLLLEDKIRNGICHKGKSASGLDQVLLTCVGAPTNSNANGNFFVLYVMGGPGLQTKCF